MNLVSVENTGGFQARLLARHVVEIPRKIVSWNHIWVGSRVRIRAHLSKIVEFEATVRKSFRFVIPKKELDGLKPRKGKLLNFEFEVLERPDPSHTL